MSGLSAMARWLTGALTSLGLLLLLLGPAAAAQAGSVDWHEVPATAEGRQWWDQGSLRLSRSGYLSVLSRVQPAGNDGDKPRIGDLYVMEIDCGQRLYRDTSVNGLPRFSATWSAAGDDELVMSVIQESCQAGAGMLQAG
jgi:hypothetical protein